MESVFVPVTEFINNNYCCRACTKQNDASDMICLFDSNKNIIGEIFTQCTSLQLSQLDGLPMNICRTCHDQLLLFNTFRLACITADNFLRNRITIKNEHSDDFNFPSFQDPVEPNCYDEGAVKSYNQSINNTEIYNRNIQLEPKSKKKKVKEDKIICTSDREDEKYEIKASDMIECKPELEYLTIDSISSVTKPNPTKKKNEIASSSSMLKCDMCMKRFNHKQHIEAHMRTHQGLRAYPCNKCDKSYVNWRSLKLHISLHHNEGDIPKFKCTIGDCDRSYPRKQSLVAHIKTIHLKIKKVMNTERRFTCETCGSSFKMNSSLQKHILIHSNELKYECELCPKKYRTKYNLQIHMHRHNGIKNHTCLECGLRTVTGRELRVHMNYHTREKQYQCQFCQKIFLNPGNMVRHVKVVHCGEKSYKCIYCEMSFGKPFTLKQHIMTHTGEKPHKCEICGRRFIQFTALKTHTKTHRK